MLQNDLIYDEIYIDPLVIFDINKFYGYFLIAFVHLRSTLYKREGGTGVCSPPRRPGNVILCRSTVVSRR